MSTTRPEAEHRDYDSILRQMEVDRPALAHMLYALVDACDAVARPDGPDGIDTADLITGIDRQLLQSPPQPEDFNRATAWLRLIVGPLGWRSGGSEGASS